MEYSFKAKFTSDEDFGDKKPIAILSELLKNEKAFRKFEMTETQKKIAIIENENSQKKIDPFDDLFKDLFSEI